MQQSYYVMVMASVLDDQSCHENFLLLTSGSKFEHMHQELELFAEPKLSMSDMISSKLVGLFRFSKIVEE